MSDTQSSIFLSFDGVTGEMRLPPDSVVPGPGKDWTQLLSMHMSADVNAMGRNLGKAAARIDFGGNAPPIRIAKETNAATVALMREFLSPTVRRNAAIVFVRTDQEAPTEYMRFELTDCDIVAFDMTGSGEDRAVEELGLLYRKLTIITFGGGHGAKGARSPVEVLNGG